jgi:hypothetical protein
VSSFHVGGVPELSYLLERPHHVSSPGLDGGCLRLLHLEGSDVLARTPAQEEGTGPCARGEEGPCEGAGRCGGEGECHDDWESAWCDCPPGTSGDSCSQGK